jgi:nucleotide-binding universal stress UspA family protein
MEGPIVVGTDGSDTATTAVQEAIELAKRFERELHIVSAYQQQQLKAEGMPAEFAGVITSRDRVDAVLDNAASAARAAGVKATTHPVKGDAAEAIIDVAGELGAGLIVVGNKGIGSLRRFILGNVPSKVVHSSPCSTYVVHTA